MRSHPGDTRPSAFAAAALGLIFPGLGHLYLGRRRRALAFAAPGLLALAALGAVAVTSAGRRALVASVFSPDTLQLLLVLDAAVFAYRLAAIVDAYLLARAWPVPAPVPSRARRAIAAQASLVGLAVAAVSLSLLHLAVARDDRIAYDALVSITSGSGTALAAGPSGSPGGSPASASAAGSPSPAAATAPGPSLTPWNGSGRLNVLLVGSDQRPPDPTFNTDTMIVASIDPATGSVAMFSVPRDTVNVPVPPSWAAASQWGGVYPRKINSLWTYADENPGLFAPGARDPGAEALKGALGQLLGIQIRYYVMVNFTGFRQVVDTLGGAMIDVQAPVEDYHFPSTDGRGGIKLYIPPGFQLMDGEQALDYARARHETNDFDRSQRQQRVIVSLRQQTDLLSFLDPNRLQAMSDALRSAIHTDFPAQQLPALVSLLQAVDTTNLQSFVFTPPTYQVECADPSLSCFYSLSPKVAAIRQAVRDALSGNVTLERSRQKLASEAATVWVENGSGRAGQAASVADYLDYLGVNATVPAVNGGDATGPPGHATVVTFYNGAEKRMPETVRVLQATFGVTIRTATDPAGKVDAIVVTGTGTPTLVVPSQ